MNDENRKIVQAAVKEAGDYLNGKLPTHPDHPERNPYAHLWRSIRDKMGSSYKDCEDDHLPIILHIIAWHRKELK